MHKSGRTGCSHFQAREDTGKFKKGLTRRVQVGVRFLGALTNTDPDRPGHVFFTGDGLWSIFDSSCCWVAFGGEDWSCADNQNVSKKSPTKLLLAFVWCWVCLQDIASADCASSGPLGLCLVLGICFLSSGSSCATACSVLMRTVPGSTFVGHTFVPESCHAPVVSSTGLYSGAGTLSTLFQHRSLVGMVDVTGQSLDRR